jgi:hypothetical protein
MNLSTMFDSIEAYDKLFKQFGYVPAGTGATEWSHRVSHTDGSTVDFRYTDWVYTGDRGTHRGRTATELKEFLLEVLSREELVKLLLT